VRGFWLNNYLPYTLHDIYVWSFCAFVLFFRYDWTTIEYKNKLPDLFARLLFFSLPFTVIIFFQYLNSDLDIINRELTTGINGKAIYQPILFAPMLMPFILDFNKIQKTVVLASNVFLLIIGILSATRILIIVPLLGFATLLFQYKKNMFIKTILILFLTFIFMNAVIKLLSEPLYFYFSNKIEYTILRFALDENISTNRDTEVEGLFKNFTTTEFFIGRGAGGSHIFGFWETMGTIKNLGVPFTHFGFLNLILKGGFPLLIIVYGLAIGGMISLWRKGERRYFFVILIYLVYEISHSQFNNPFYMIFLWTGIGYSLQYKRSITNDLNRSKALHKP
jgi:hypothetical protein